MKQIFFLVLFFFLVSYIVYSQEIPAFVQHKIDSLQDETRRSLNYYRIWNINTDGNMTLPRGLGFFAPGRDNFSYRETLLIEDTLKLNLSVGMIYDNEMRERLMQLLRNEYQEWELDTLVNRQIGNNVTMYEENAMKMCRFDTIELFKLAVDSFYLDIVSKSKEDFKKHLKEYESFFKEKYYHDVFKLLKLDTTTTYRQVYSNIIERKKEEIKKEWLTDMYSYFSGISYLAELCGYIGDKCFVQPLIEIFDKPFEFKNSKSESRWQENIYKSVRVALVRLRVEPYYSDYLKKRMLTNEPIMDDNWLDFSLDDFVYVIGTQEAFLELSKYLLSNKPDVVTVIDYDDHTEYHNSPVSQTAFNLIGDYIDNKDLQEMIGGKSSSKNPELIKPIYDWMQENYGRYQIKRIW